MESIMSSRHRLPTVYIAGPFRALHADGSVHVWKQEQNIRRAEALLVRLIADRPSAVAVICPHSMTRYCAGAAPDSAWLDADLELLARCDAMLVAPGWQTSFGTKAEIALANRLNIPVFGITHDFEADYADCLGWLDAWRASEAAQGA
jgi:hypothetical protein